MKNFFKQLFCNHKKCKFIRNIYGDEINQYNGARSIWVCSNCGKQILRNYIDLNDIEPRSYIVPENNNRPTPIKYLTVEIPRRYKAGEINAAHGLEYKNMEECIKEYMENNLKISSVIYVRFPKIYKDHAEYTTANFEDIVGELRMIDKEKATVKILNKEYYNLLANPVISIDMVAHFVCDNDKEFIYVDKVIGFTLDAK